MFLARFRVDTCTIMTPGVIIVLVSTLAVSFIHLLPKPSSMFRQQEVNEFSGSGH